MFAALKERWGELDAVVHSLAFAGRDELKGRYVDTSRQGFHLALDVSAYSLVAMARCAEPLLAPRRGSIVTMTYLGAERVIPHYNVMGIAKAALEHSVRYLAWDLGPSGVRINAISAGPIRTLSSAGIAGFKTMLHHHEEHAGHAHHPTPPSDRENCGICQLIAASSKATIDPPGPISIQPADIPAELAATEIAVPVTHCLGPPVERGPPAA